MSNRNSPRSTRHEVRQQLKKAKKFAAKQTTKSVHPALWREVCPKNAR